MNTRIKNALFAFFLLLCSCGNEESSIPECEVYIKTSYSEYQKLLFANSCVIYSYEDVYRVNERIGYGGVCLIRDMEKNLHAFDLACPYECLRDVTLTIEMPRATCPQCGSTFELMNGTGSPMSGPAERRMKEYTNVSDRFNLGYIIVTN